MERVAIIGAGQAGCEFAASLREKSFAGEVILLGNEGELPYQRPPLSKAFLKGEVGVEGLRIRSEAFFSKHSIDFRAEAPVLSIDRADRRCLLADGRAIHYDRLVLATGVRNRTIALPHSNAAGIFYLRGLRDAEVLREGLAQASKVAIIGAGFIGMEFAAVARQNGADVTVIELAKRSMARAISPEMSSFIEQRHVSEGVVFEFGVVTEAFEINETGAVQGVRLTDGRVIAADLVLIAIGVIPNTELAEEAGLAVQNGIVVDQTLTTDDPVVHAIGDCAAFIHPLVPTSVLRLESVQNAADQARFLARAIMGEASRYDSVPWFWSDQYDMKLQIAGIAGIGDLAERVEDLKVGAFAVRHSACGQITALETINSAREHMLARGELKRVLEARGFIAPQRQVSSTDTLGKN